MAPNPIYIPASIPSRTISGMVALLFFSTMLSSFLDMSGDE